MHVQPAQEGFADLAVALRHGLPFRARLRVEEDGAEHGLHVPARRLSVPGEGLGDARHVGRRRVRLHQALDQQAADEGPHVRMLEEVVDGGLDVFEAALSGRHDLAAQQALGPGLVEFLEHDHGRVEHRILLAEEDRVALHVLAVGQAREDLREFADVTVVVGRDRPPVRIEPLAAVGVQFEQPDGEQLHDLARVVLVRKVLATGSDFALFTCER